MATCECTIGCPFFNDQMTGMSGIADKLKLKYCMGSKNDCARYMVFQVAGSANVTSDLFPNDKRAALRIIHELKNS